MRRFPPHVRRPQDNKIWLWTAVNHFHPGILGWVLGDHSAQTFKPLWDEVVSVWKCYFYVTADGIAPRLPRRAFHQADGWPVYPMFIPDGDQIVSRLVR